jgi:toxin ParE1/3/4
MSIKPVVLRASADCDIAAATDYYFDEAGEQIGKDFVAALQHCLAVIADFPAKGSPRFAHELDLPGLRSARLRGFPYLVFYIERDDAIDVWRVLHDRRDIPAWMAQGDA